MIEMEKRIASQIKNVSIPILTEKELNAIINDKQPIPQDTQLFKYSKNEQCLFVKTVSNSNQNPRKILPVEKWFEFIQQHHTNNNVCNSKAITSANVNNSNVCIPSFAINVFLHFCCQPNIIYKNKDDIIFAHVFQLNGRNILFLLNVFKRVCRIKQFESNSELCQTIVGYMLEQNCKILHHDDTVNLNNSDYEIQYILGHLNKCKKISLDSCEFFTEHFNIIEDSINNIASSKLTTLTNFIETIKLNDAFKKKKKSINRKQKWKKTFENRHQQTTPKPFMQGSTESCSQESLLTESCSQVPTPKLQSHLSARSLQEYYDVSICFEGFFCNSFKRFFNLHNIFLGIR